MEACQRMKGSSKCTPRGVLGVLVGAAVHIGAPESIGKAARPSVFAFVATPGGSHALAKSAHAAGMPQWDGTLSDELAEDQGGIGL